MVSVSVELIGRAVERLMDAPGAKAEAEPIRRKAVASFMVIEFDVVCEIAIASSRARYCVEVIFLLQLSTEKRGRARSMETMMCVC